MKLATALAERSDIQNRINTISVRLDNNAKVQEGDVPAEDPKALMEELDRLIVRLEDLVARINLTNSGTVYEGKTITELLAHRDCLKKKVRVLRDFLNTASDRVTRMTRTEIKIVSTVPVSEIQKTVDGLAKELRTVDEKIQELNWATELVGGCISISRECADYGQKLRAGFRGSSPHLTTHCQQRNMRIVTNSYYHLASTVDRVGI